MIKELIYLIIILLGIPFGLFLAKICKEEIKAWKKRMFIIIFSCFIIGIALLFSGFEYKIPSIAGLGFIIMLFLTIIYSSNKKLKQFFNCS